LWHQARHENRRRWLTLDLLTGRLTRDHPLFGIFESAGISEDRLRAFDSGDALPDLIGVDHYLTSERYLDHRVELYPGVEAGGNGRQTYVDLEAVRIPRLADRVGPARRLREAWARYRIPLVFGEVHHGCSRDEQLRWFDQVWRETGQVRAEGVDVRAVTLWALFGTVDWRSLLTRREGQYDAGAFDIRSPEPRPTLIARAALAYASAGRFEHPALEADGWWRRPERTYPAMHGGRAAKVGRGRPILVTGARGTLGQAFARVCSHRGLAFVLADRHMVDIADPASIDAAIDAYTPWAVVNAAGFVRVIEAEVHRDECFRANADGPGHLAAACKAMGLPLVTFSSDLVFDGSLGRSYVEPDPAAPSTAYGASKAEGEKRVLAAYDDALVIRSGAFFGPWDRYNFLYETLRRLAHGEEAEASATRIVSPTYVPELVQATLDLLLDEASGLWHLTNAGSVSFHDLAREAAERSGLDKTRIRIAETEASDTSLASNRGFLLRPLDQALASFIADAETLSFA
jgi:dTDP-4-dehydrorhamnose reductase